MFNLFRSGNPPTKITGQSQGETERREKVGKAKNPVALILQITEQSAFVVVLL